MNRFYLRASGLYVALRAVADLLHYLGPSPWGGALVESPSRLLPEALALDVASYLVLAAGFALLEGAVPAAGRALRAAYLAVASGLAVFSQVDLEVVRWLGQHMTLSYILNFAGARDGQLFVRILSGDRLFSALAGLQMLAALAAAPLAFSRWASRAETLPRGRAVRLIALTLLVAALPFAVRPSEKRWRRVRPASIGLVVDGVRTALALDAPADPARAHQDLVDLVHRGRFDAGAAPKDARYPLLREDNVGSRGAAELRALPLAERPDVLLVVFETLRGMNSGLLEERPDARAAMPLLAGRIRQEARYFPRVHSAGYPSVEGALGMHLGVWPHHEKIVFSSYLDVPLWSFPELLRTAGYRSYALLGADPSFSNFTPWFRRWYDSMEYDPARHHDGPLVDRFIELYDAAVGDPAPRLWTVWTVTTHPPYDVPAESGVTPAGTNEERYVQAMRYADAQISRLVDHVRSSPRGERTVVFVLGDHSQPTPWQWQRADQIGDLHPGHTWTSLAIFGGGRFAPRPGRVDAAISHVALAPSILAAAGLRHPNHFFTREVLHADPEGPVAAFRYGTMAVEQGDERAIFRVSGGAPLGYRFDPTSVESYGALEGGHRAPAGGTIPVDRYRDVALAWAELLEGRRVAPAFLGSATP